jgi:hypothetical protein
VRHCRIRAPDFRRQCGDCARVMCFQAIKTIFFDR